MTEGAVHLLLCALFDWHLRSEETGYPPVNILYKVSQGGGRSVPGHRILCPDMHPDIRRVQVAFSGLETDERILVVTKHMPAPKHEDGTPQFKKWGDREKADYLQEPAFKSKYRKCLRKIKKVL